MGEVILVCAIALAINYWVMRLAIRHGMRDAVTKDTHDVVSSVMRVVEQRRERDALIEGRKPPRG